MRRRAVILSAGLLAAPGLVTAQSLRPIRMIVPFPPGGATDALSRIAAGKLQEKLGQTVVVENRSGGNGVVGGMALIQSQPDGLTIMASASIQALLHRVLHSIPFDPINDMTPIARTAGGPLLFVIDLRRAERNEEPIKEHLLITRYAPARVDKGEMLSVENICDILCIPLIGVVPESQAVLLASNEGVPVIHKADTDVAQAYQDVVSRFMGDELPMRFLDAPPTTRTTLASMSCATSTVCS